MLLIRRGVGQAIHIGPNVVVTIKAIEGGRVTVDVVAPREILVLRDELFRRKPAASVAVETPSEGEQ